VTVEKGEVALKKPNTQYEAVTFLCYILWTGFSNKITKISKYYNIEF